MTAQAVTAGTALVLMLMLEQRAFDEALSQSEALPAHVDRFKANPGLTPNPYGEASIDVVSGHEEEPDPPGTFVDYELSLRESELSVAQTVLRVRTRVADLYNEPMNQVEQQLRLTIEALREHQAHEMITPGTSGCAQRRSQAAHPHRHRPAHTPTTSMSCWPWSGRSRAASWRIPKRSPRWTRKVAAEASIRVRPS